MASSKTPWVVHDYTIPASYPRGFRRGVQDAQKSRLKLSVKEYIPNARSDASGGTNDEDNGITLILHHGMPPAAVKEAWEPFMSDLLGFRGLPPVRAIWTYDVVAFGQSYSLNKDQLGDVQHWHDSARDLLQMVNYFQDRMRPPLVGIGQSWGSVAIAMAASWSPQLFYGIIFSEPVLESAYNLQQKLRAQGVPDSKIYAMHTGVRFMSRKTRWKSMQEARDKLSESAVFKLYDPRVLELILKHEFVQQEDGSLVIIPPNPVVVSYFMRPMPSLPGIVPDPEEHKIQQSSITLPGFGNAQSPQTADALKNITCKVLYLWATDSIVIASPNYHERMLSATGSGSSGGGGIASGQVDEMIVEGGHSLPYFVPSRTATAVGTWLRDTIWKNWVMEQELIMKEPPNVHSEFSSDFMVRIRKTVPKL